MAQWKELLRRSFSENDHIFSRGAPERARAREMLSDVIATDATWDDIETEARIHLAAMGCAVDKVDAEIARILDVRNYIR
jgi:hypothetical protein